MPTNIISKLRLENLFLAARRIIVRFPWALLIILSIFSLLAFSISAEPLAETTKDILVRSIIALVASFFFSLAACFLAESRNLYGANKHLPQILSLIVAVLFYVGLGNNFDFDFFDNNRLEILVFVSSGIAAIVSFAFISWYSWPVDKELQNQSVFYSWSYHVVLAGIMAVIVGMMVFILGMIALSSIFLLFDLPENSKLFAYWATFTWVLVAPSFFLANLPAVSRSEQSEAIAANRFFSFLVNNVFLPAVTIYFIILYAYTTKVLFNFKEWPHGEVSWLVIAFSFFGYLAYFAAYAFVPQKKLATYFRRYLPLAVLLQTPMLFYAIGLRINQYDLTLNRYLVLAFGAWLVVLSFYHLISKAKDLCFFFSSLILTIIIISLGPWSLYALPEQRQLARLENKLVQAGILKADASIVPLASEGLITEELARELDDIIAYMFNNHGRESLVGLFSQEILAVEAEYLEEQNDRIGLEAGRRIRAYDLANGLSRNLGLYHYLQTSIEYGAGDWIVRNYSRNSATLAGYEYYVRFDWTDGKENDPIIKKQQDWGIEVDRQKNQLDLYKQDNLVDSFLISPEQINTIQKKASEKTGALAEGKAARVNLDDEDMTFSVSGNTYEGKLVLEGIRVWDKNKPDPDNDFSNNEIQGYLLLRKK